MRDLDDLQVYRRLMALSEELSALAERAHSPATSTALAVASRLVRRLASAVFARGL